MRNFFENIIGLAIGVSIGLICIYTYYSIFGSHLFDFVTPTICFEISIIIFLFVTGKYHIKYYILYGIVINIVFFLCFWVLISLNLEEYSFFKESSLDFIIVISFSLLSIILSKMLIDKFFILKLPQTGLRLIEFSNILFKKKNRISHSQIVYYMGDNYNIHGDAGAIGKHATANNTVFNKSAEGNSQLNFDEIAEVLAELRMAMQSKALTTEHFVEIGNIAKAEQAAKAKDENKVIEFLKTSGKWTMDFVKEVGTKVATEYIKKHMGI